MVLLVTNRPVRGARLVRAALAAAALSVTAVTGCAPTQPPDTPTDFVPSTPPPFDGRLGSSAVDLATHSGSWPATEKLLREASEKLVRDCMRNTGFAYPAVAAPAPRAPEDEPAAVELPDRRRSGYGIASTEQGGLARSNAPIDRYYETLPQKERKRFDRALFGPPEKRERVTDTDWGEVSVPRQGCRADSEKRLAGDVRLWARITYVPEKIDNQLGQRVPRTPAYRAALSDWRSCMRARGHAYATPESIQPRLKKEYQKSGATEKFRQHEKDVAVADGECALKAHIPAVSLRVQRHLVATLPARDKATLASLAFHRDTAVARGREVLAQEP
ncbi:hypothetical protein [Streptomyces luteocolor]|uniref:hypothetical protein n=1 Tax=Streptomyces luteocolor TaxID=285500 RepID=UPI0008535B73|nr:hypothetical protein [Streptomyces luteocolor]